MAPYSSDDIHCYMCKEKLKVEKDGNQDTAINPTSTEVVTATTAARGQNSSILGPNGMSGILNQNCDENCYFIEAKKIRVSIRNKETGQVEKKEVTVHVECLKQLEQLKTQAKAQAELNKTADEGLGSNSLSMNVGQKRAASSSIEQL